MPIRILAYCLMPNHWHFVLWPRAEGEISELMKPCVGASTEGVCLARIHGKRQWWSNLAWNILCVRVEDLEKYVRNKNNEPCPIFFNNKLQSENSTSCVPRRFPLILTFSVTFSSCILVLRARRVFLVLGQVGFDQALGAVAEGDDGCL